MTERQRRDAIRQQQMACGWCGVKISWGAYVVDRPAGPVAFCDTCRHRYDNPERHPYVRKALAAKGR